MYFRVFWTPLLCCIMILNHGRTTESANIPSRRHTNKREAVPLPESFSFQTLQNASMVSCESGLLGGARPVELSDVQMINMLQRKGGNYIREYMAATQEEALENFPNIFMLAAPIKVRSGNGTITVYDNYISKYTIMEDLQKLMFYMMNITGTDGKPVMGMMTVSASHDNTSTISRAMSRPTKIVDATTTDTPTVKDTVTPYPIPPSPNRTSRKYLANGTSTLFQTPPFPIQTTAKSSLVGKRSSTTPITNILTKTTKDVSNTNSSESSSASISLTDTLTTSKVTAFAGDQSASQTTATKTATSQASASSHSEFVSASSYGSPRASTTKDPNVVHSLLGLNQYVNGLAASHNFTNKSEAELDDMWQAANTTIHPSALFGLTFGSRRRKRNADGSSSQPQYCQPRGTQTDDGQYMHMCSICAVTTKLPDDFFPRYINEAVCQATDNACFTVHGTDHGRCLQRPFTLNVLRKSTGRCAMVRHEGEDIVMDDWQLQPKTIRVFCECAINKISVFSAYVRGPSFDVGR